ncbi:DUF2243 domain-containing protein [Rubrobacter marinus]|uniref:DUF2243 domain-containing protein n=1 Tax=Rubrobacter marinus TaxID=2653852 RepID=A0A6G8PTA9_9ACTN|nr:DUF2243 domain-containing protein [Rubrobacter marinus]QIN77563.1 DUF2243 domain-containing protein [Rubrobacter marinus]
MDLRRFVTAGVILGLGLGGFFDGIVLHQVLQWHHMLTATSPPTSVGSLELNTLWDGLFHVATYAFTIAGVLLLWRAARASDALPPTRTLVGALLMGWGIFNLVEGIVNYHLLGIHHVLDSLPPGLARLALDLAFLALGAAFVLFGRRLIRESEGSVSARPSRVR